jgi:hypothetical protein
MATTCQECGLRYHTPGGCPRCAKIEATLAVQGGPQPEPRSSNARIALPAPEVTRLAPSVEPSLIECPMCTETVKAHAKVCRCCQYYFLKRTRYPVTTAISNFLLFVGLVTIGVGAVFMALGAGAGGLLIGVEGALTCLLSYVISAAVSPG